jgi:hypothetical protein
MGLLGILGGVTGLLRLAMIVGPLLYALSTFNTYRSQGITIEAQRNQIEKLVKQNEAWAGRYARIDIKRDEYKTTMKRVNEAIHLSGPACERKIQSTLRELTDLETIRQTQATITQQGQ